MLDATDRLFTQSYSVQEPLIVSSALPLDDAMRGGVLMLGNFDGFHRGHRELARLAQSVPTRTCIGLMSCEPHPRAFFGVETEAFRLATKNTKSAMLGNKGIDFVFEPTFDSSFARQTPEEFITEVLCGALGVSHVVTGPDFRFGHRRSGDVRLLQEMSRRFGFGISVAESLKSGSQTISSTRIRNLIRDGQINQALELLGDPWIIEVERTPNGKLRMHPSLCRPRAGCYKSSLQEPFGRKISIDLDVDEDGYVSPKGPLPTVNRYLFQICGQASNR